MATAGISSILNIAKEALLTHQASIAVAGHNIANVDTPGYSRQVLNVTTSQPTPDRVGFFGNGVRGESISRQYDQFMVQRLMDQNSSISDLTAQNQSMKVLETTFNEVPGLAVNDLMSQFWESWQALSNNPELSADRQTVVQQASLLNEQLQTMTAEITQTKSDIDVDLKSSISDINSLTIQLADLNGKIASSETSIQQQNDLRDTRDQLLTELSGFLDLNYFESGNGAYTIMMDDGHSLVEGIESWSLDWSDNTLHWVSTNSLGDTTSSVLQDDVLLGGKVGGLMTMYNLIKEGDPDNYLGRLNALANAMIREVNQLHSQGVGTVNFSDQLIGAETANDTVLLHTTVDAKTATDTITEGTLTVNDRTIGKINGAIAINGLAMGKTYNAVQAINLAEAGVDARMTTLVAGNGIANGLNNTETVSFSINGITVSYTATANETAAESASNISIAINSAITAYNNQTIPQANTPKITIESVVGNGLNGGATNAIVLRNTNKGDESQIIIAGVDNTDPAELKLGLTDGTYLADATHNTGELSTFSWEGPVKITGGSDDTTMAHLGWGGSLTYSNNAVIDEPAADGLPSSISFDLNSVNINVTIPNNTAAANAAQMAVDAINLLSTTTGVTAEVGDGLNGGLKNAIIFKSETTDIKVKNYTLNTGTDILGFNNFTKLGVASADETAGDGKLTYTYDDNGVANSLMGLAYTDSLETDNGSFEMWLYNTDGTLALAQPVSISLERAYDLNDVANAINTSISNAINDPTVTSPWVEASVVANQLVFTPDASHNFAFGSDTSNFLAAAGINTFFTGYDASTIGINSVVAEGLDNLAAGQINEFGEIFAGDNSNALLLTNIQRNENISFTGGRVDTLDGFYNSLVAEIGINGKSINADIEYNKLVDDQLKELRDATSGVSLDEEMANLIKFQHAYTAAARLITISDEMMQTLLDTI